MAFWNRDNEDGEWEKYQKSKKKDAEPREGEGPSAADEFRAYFKTVRQAQPTENADKAKPDEPGLTAKGMLDSFVSSFKPDKAEEPEKPEEPPEKCPWCGKEMQKGYLNGGRDGARWSAERPGLFVSSVSIQDEGGWLGSAYKVCWFCKDCRKIVFDTAGLEPPLGKSGLPESALHTMSDADRAAYMRDVMSGMSDAEKIAYAQTLELKNQEEAQEETKEGE